ncbi:hypothetical protein [Lysinibacillus sp. JNUCC 51]|uniref:hypothetical protein n=1 Tax=Lysinibacillus sp. JNUCC-51 TaxID=2792479 RepID=UPI00193627A8|nr:hypothetical protein JNUCC51_15935 [Lysinibacillus sp. JNUCC-51]
MLDKIKASIKELKFFKSNTENRFNGHAMQNNANEIHQHFMDPRLLMNQLVSEGQYNLAVDVLKDVTKALENSHPLAPKYYYDVRKLGDKIFLTSKPANEVVAQENPITYRGKMTISDEGFRPEIGIDKYFFQQSLRNIPIKVRIDSLEELIGGVIIDNPLSILDSLGEGLNTSVMPNSDRPIIKAKMSMKRDNKFKVIIDYLEMQLTDYDAVNEILTISNMNQQIAYLNIELKIPMKNISMDNEMLEIIGMNYNIVLRDEYCSTVEGELFFLEFLSLAEISDVVQIWDIERNRLICEGTGKQTKVGSSKISEYDTQIKTLKMLKSMEDKYSVKFMLPEKIEEEEQEQLLHLLTIAWESKEVDFHVTDLTASVSDKQSILNMVEIIEDNEESMFSIESTQTISGELFGVNIECRSKKILIC